MPTEDELDDEARRVLRKLNRILYLRRVEENEQIASGKRLARLNRAAKELYDQ